MFDENLSLVDCMIHVHGKILVVFDDVAAHCFQLLLFLHVCLRTSVFSLAFFCKFVYVFVYSLVKYVIIVFCDFAASQPF